MNIPHSDMINALKQAIESQRKQGRACGSLAIANVASGILRQRWEVTTTTSFDLRRLLKRPQFVWVDGATDGDTSGWTVRNNRG